LKILNEETIDNSEGSHPEINQTPNRSESKIYASKINISQRSKRPINKQAKKKLNKSLNPPGSKINFKNQEE
jgi:hypothetical protein